MARREFSRKVRKQAIERADVFMVSCAHCRSEFDRGYRISARRAANPQYCSPQCRREETKLRAETAMASLFWTRTERQPTGCLHWTGRRDPNGYGRIDFRGAPRLAHRVAYELTYGEAPGDRFVCHSCDNPSCVEPAHLWLGSQSDNMSDAATKGRLNSSRGNGSDNPASKLSEEHARQIKFGSDSAPRIAAQFGVSKETVYAIRKGKTWGWL